MDSADLTAPGPPVLVVHAAAVAAGTGYTNHPANRGPVHTGRDSRTDSRVSGPGRRSGEIGRGAPRLHRQVSRGPVGERAGNSSSLNHEDSRTASKRFDPSITVRDQPLTAQCFRLIRGRCFVLIARQRLDTEIAFLLPWAGHQLRRGGLSRDPPDRITITLGGEKRG
ncbi:hypothetical protein GCM10027436_24860 [Actinophytocola sediminis]